MNIEITVALPVFNSKDIVWLALEGLARQEDITFDWELIVCEENTGWNEYGEENFKKFYEERLKEKRCVRFLYLRLDKWIPLSQKWQLIGQNMAETSEVFVMQAADCYSPPKRLRRTYDIFQMDLVNKKTGEVVEKIYDWYNQSKGFFYNINLEKTILFDIITLNFPTGLNMAFRAIYARNLFIVDIPKAVDRCLYNQCVALKKNELNTFWDQNDWNLSLDSDGMNNLSEKRKFHFMRGVKPPFVEMDVKIESIVPVDIANRLKELKDFNKNSLDKIENTYNQS